ISTSGLALLLATPIKRGAILTVQLEGVAANFAEPMLVSVVRVTQPATGKWLAGCSFSCNFTERDVQALLHSADAPPAPPSSQMPPVTEPVPARDPFSHGSSREQRKSPRRGGAAVKVFLC